MIRESHAAAPKATFVVFYFYLIASSSSQFAVYSAEEKAAGKEERSPASAVMETDVRQSLDRNKEQQDEESPVDREEEPGAKENGISISEEDEDTPAGFISPSVREYLELGKSIPGKPGTDYPILSVVPYTDFYCDQQPYPGFFADMETRCQVWHYCDVDGRQTSFLCPNGTQFSQAVFVCDWWFNVNCSLSPQLYAINDRLYRNQRKKVDSTKPHRVITKQLIDSIFKETRK